MLGYLVQQSSFFSGGTPKMEQNNAELEQGGAVDQFINMGYLSRIGYAPAAPGHVCHYCGQSGFVWSKALPKNEGEQFMCGACNGHRVVRY
jgi:hypothetical protein